MGGCSRVPEQAPVYVLVGGALRWVPPGPSWSLSCLFSTMCYLSGPFCSLRHQLPKGLFVASFHPYSPSHASQVLSLIILVGHLAPRQCQASMPLLGPLQLLPLFSSWVSLPRPSAPGLCSWAPAPILPVLGSGLLALVPSPLRLWAP